MSFALFTLGLVLTAAFTALAGVLWMTLLYQKVIY
jgi:hypothetical protein